MADLVRQDIINLDVRPIRAAYVIRSGDTAAFSRAVVLACDRWGGLQEPIVPVGPKGRLIGFWRQAIEIARPDVLVDLAGLDATAHQGLTATFGPPVMREEHFEQFGDRIHPLGTFSADELRGLTTIAPATESIGGLAACGAVPDGELEDWRGFGVTVEFSGSPDVLLRAQLQARTPLGLSIHDCGDLFVEGWGGGFGLIWVAEPDSLRDALLFWNYRARMPVRSMGTFAALLTGDDARRAGAIRDAIVARIHALPVEVEPSFSLCSRSVSPAELRDILRRWEISEWTERRITHHLTSRRREHRQVTAAINWRPLIPVGRRIEGVRAREVAHIFRPSTKLLVNSPVSFHPEIGGVVHVRISGPPELSFPRSSAVARLAHPSALPSEVGFELRTSASPAYEFDVNVPRQEEVLRELLRERGIDFTINEKGGHARGLLRLVEDPVIFGHSDVDKVANAFVQQRSKRLAAELSKALKGLTKRERAEVAALFASDRRRGYLTLEQATSKSGLQRPAVVRVLDVLMKHRLAERGLEVDCSECGLKSFVPFAASEEPCSCPACSSSARYTVANDEPRTYYRLNALLERACDQGVLVQTFATAGLIRRDANCHVLPACDLRRAAQGLGEADFLCLSGGDLLFGEAKRTVAWFTQTQLRRDARLAAAVGARQYVLACLQPVPDAVEKRALDICQRHGLDVLVIDGPEANPREVRPAPPSPASV